MIKVINQAQKEYPQKLNKIYAPPAKLYLMGEVAILNKPAIAIVGCRDASNYGKKVAFEFAYDLAKKGIVVVSRVSKAELIFTVI